jgi:hypothetical protein
MKTIIQNVKGPAQSIIKAAQPHSEIAPFLTTDPGGIAQFDKVIPLTRQLSRKRSQNRQCDNAAAVLSAVNDFFYNFLEVALCPFNFPVNLLFQALLALLLAVNQFPCLFLNFPGNFFGGTFDLVLVHDCFSYSVRWSQICDMQVEIL